jgi:hypothetical protein
MPFTSAQKLLSAKARTKKRDLTDIALKDVQNTQIPFSPIRHILDLQRIFGNRAVQRPIKSGLLQKKLRLGKSKDNYEQNADRVANQVMAMPMPPCGLQHQPKNEEEEEQIQRAAPPVEQPVSLDDIEAPLAQTKGAGRPLPYAPRAFFETRFDADFSDVRVHTGTDAVHLSSNINAEAFTYGSDIYFNLGKYNPYSSEGQQLLAHELAHVVQQGNVKVQAPRTIQPGNRNIIQRKTRSIERGQGLYPRVLASGREAAEQVAKQLPNGLSAKVAAGGYGWIELRPGLIYMGDRMVVSATGATVTYTVGEKLFITSTPQFMQDEWSLAISKGARSAIGMVYLIEIEMALLQGIFVPWYVLLGMTAAKVGLFYRENKKYMDLALSHSGDLISLLSWFITNHPKLFAKLIWEGIRGEDVAFFIGRVIRKTGGLINVTLKSLLRIAHATLLIVTAIHALPAAVRGVGKIEAAAEENLARAAKKLKKAMEEAEITLSDEEAIEIIENLIGDHEAIKKLKSLEGTLDELIPVLEKLEEALRPWSGTMEKK